MVLDIAWFKDGLEKCIDYIKTDGYGYFLYHLHIFVWVQQDCLNNTAYVLDSDICV